MTQFDSQTLLRELAAGATLSAADARVLATVTDIAGLARSAAARRDLAHGAVVSYSKKVFVPLTRLCRDVCHYCTFAQTPKHVSRAYMSVEEVLELCRAGERMGCKEALFTLGERPELRYRAARQALRAMGYASTLDYVAAVAGQVLEHSTLLPHINAGCMDAAEIALLRPVAASMGIMLESAAERLCERGMPHYGSPDKQPARRLQTLDLAGAAAVPITSGILIGIGETRAERIDALLLLRASQQRYGHLQEVIIQNFRAKQGTLMARAPEPSLAELLWTIAVARLIFEPAMNIQAPPNLSPGVLPQLLAAGINDWGGVSPLTPDYVNPEAPWPQLDALARETAASGKHLQQRLTLYPAWVRDPVRWLDPALRTRVARHSDAEGFARTGDWCAGATLSPPQPLLDSLQAPPDAARIDARLRAIIARCERQLPVTEADVERLYRARGAEFAYLCQRADRLRRQVCGERVSYVVNRNINYTNICYFKCRFCAFSKGKLSENLRGRPYDLAATEIARRSVEAWQRGATEVCMQGGIHPEYSGQTYLDILATVKQAAPELHIHAFSPLEVWQGAATLELELEDYLRRLRAAGLGSLPGTAAEILDDEVRAVLCPDKINTQQWLQVMETAHRVGFNSTATLMYGHIEQPRHWARHLLRIRALQQRSGGFTEFVPLPFVPLEAPLYLQGRARPGPTFREAVLMHAVARLVLHGQIDNIQTSWVKMGPAGVAACLAAGANDLGGSLMNETITRAAGARHGQEWSPQQLSASIRALGREPWQRDTLYRPAPEERQQCAVNAAPLAVVVNTPARKYERERPQLVRNQLLTG